MIDPDGVAASVGVACGDVILEVNSDIQLGEPTRWVKMVSRFFFSVFLFFSFFMVQFYVGYGAMFSVFMVQFYVGYDAKLSEAY